MKSMEASSTKSKSDKVDTDLNNDDGSDKQELRSNEAAHASAGAESVKEIIDQPW